MSDLYDNRACFLGEGPLWHPERKDLFWFDIMNKKMMTKTQEWHFDTYVSAAGWVSQDQLVVASADALSLFDISTGKLDTLTALEADNPITRSNDGRADPMGGFWIGTMGLNLEKGAGAIYRYFRGEVRCLFPNISISNSICFSPDGLWAYFADTPDKTINRVALDEDGWPKRDPEVVVDLRQTDLNPDGSVVDAEGNIWNAQWGAHRVACYAPDGALIRFVEFPPAHTSCPAFGGENLTDLFVTSAQEHISADAVKANPSHGQTFVARNVAQGQAEHRVIL